MPLLIEPALSADTFRSPRQSCLIVGDRLVPRPWCVDDAKDVEAAFACPVIQRRHVRRVDGADASWAVVEAREDRPVGQVGLRALSLFEASAQLSCWVCQPSAVRESRKARWRR
ncbi:hypothetical protein P3102_20405 [Amycolatopsis sp. QT-25]|uniref:hypothetical protein n=1 Tax=Amycolatopsis sp. QT-25 TaxID=3034022 RepID=UPI0023EDD74A|nr:hypothetical protein [Amycolatopsis sp. QT-25]WET76490.1 hypothetical protein P3102_20405 [Amycolatopsis sp. QT-25]